MWGVNSEQTGRKLCNDVDQVSDVTARQQSARPTCLHYPLIPSALNTHSQAFWLYRNRLLMAAILRLRFYSKQINHTRDNFDYSL